jgi:hypothetical protein
MATTSHIHAVAGGYDERAALTRAIGHGSRPRSSAELCGRWARFSVSDTVWIILHSFSFRRLRSTALTAD